MAQLRLPHVTGQTAEAQLQQLKRSLIYLVQELNFLLENAQKEENNGKNQ